MRSKQDIEDARLRQEIASAFESGEILDKDDKTLLKYLMRLCSGFVLNEYVRHREIIRGLTINSIQMQRHIDRLNRRNRGLQIIVIILTLVVIFTAAFQTYMQVRYSRGKSLRPTQEVLPQRSETIPTVHDEANKDDSSTIE